MPGFDQTNDFTRQKMRGPQGSFNPFDQELAALTMLTDYHAKYFAHELTKRCSSDSLEKLAGTVACAQVDLNPHQVDAALFAFRSPLKGSSSR